MYKLRIKAMMRNEFDPKAQRMGAVKRDDAKFYLLVIDNETAVIGPSLGELSLQSDFAPLVHL